MSKGMDEVKLGPGWMPLTRKTGLSTASALLDDTGTAEGKNKPGGAGAGAGAGVVGGAGAGAGIVGGGGGGAGVGGSGGASAAGSGPPGGALAGGTVAAAATGGGGTVPGGKQRFAKDEVLGVYRMGLSTPRGIQDHPGVTLKDPGAPVNLLPPDQQIAEQHVNSIHRRKQTKLRTPAFTQKSAGEFSPMITGATSRRNLSSSSESQGPNVSVSSNGQKRTAAGGSFFGHGTATSDKSWQYWTRGSRSNADSTLNWRSDVKAVSTSPVTSSSPMMSASPPTPTQLPPLLATNRRDLSALIKQPNERDAEKEKAALLTDPRRIWQYRDPQGDIQGPFSAAQLMEWLKAGYYTDELPIRRVEDKMLPFKALAYAFKMKVEDNSAPPGFVRGEKAGGADRHTVEDSAHAVELRGTRSPDLSSSTVTGISDGKYDMSEDQEVAKSAVHAADERPEPADPVLSLTNEDASCQLSGRGVHLNEAMDPSKRLRGPKTVSPIGILNMKAKARKPMKEHETSSTATVAPRSHSASSTELSGPLFSGRGAGSPSTSRFANLMGSDPMHIGAVVSAGSSMPAPSTDGRTTASEDTMSPVGGPFALHQSRFSNVLKQEQPQPPLQQRQQLLDEHHRKEPSILQMLANSSPEASPEPVVHSSGSLMDLDPAIASFGYQMGPASQPVETPWWSPYGTLPPADKMGVYPANPYINAHQMPMRGPLPPPVMAWSLQQPGGTPMPAMGAQVPGMRAPLGTPYSMDPQLPVMQPSLRMGQAEGGMNEMMNRLHDQEGSSLLAPSVRARVATAPPPDELKSQFPREEVSLQAALPKTVEGSGNSRDTGVPPLRENSQPVRADQDLQSERRTSEEVEKVDTPTTKPLTTEVIQQQQTRSSTRTVSAREALIESEANTKTKDQPSASKVEVGGEEWSTVTSENKRKKKASIVPSQGAATEPQQPVVKTQPLSGPTTEVGANFEGEQRGVEVTLAELADKDGRNPAPKPTKVATPWTTGATTASSKGATSLREIQVEEARKTELEKRRKHEIAKEAQAAAEAASPAPRAVNTASAWGAAPAPVVNTSLLDILREEATQRDQQEKSRVKKGPEIVKETPTRLVPPAASKTGVWGAATQSQPATSLREQMRLEEERKLRAVAANEAQGVAPTGTAWASKVAAGARPERPLGVTKVAAQRKPVPSPAPVIVTPSPHPTATSTGNSKSNDEDGEMFWETVGRGGSTKKVRHVQQVPSPAAVPPVVAKRPAAAAPVAAAAKKPDSEEAAISNASTGAFGATMTAEFNKWCQTEMRRITGSADTTLPEFLYTLGSPQEIKEYVVAYLGSTEEVTAFADEFVRRRNFEIGHVAGGSTTRNMTGGNGAWSVAGNGDSSGKKKGRKPKGARADLGVLGMDSGRVTVDRNDMD